MTAAEVNFPNPPSNCPGWLALAQKVFNCNDQINRWDPETCNGGLRWPIYPFESSQTHKNSITNGCHFQLGTRLARYTGDNTYTALAEQDWEWMSEIGLISSNHSVYDGASAPNCSTITINLDQWSYNNAQLLSGVAYLYNCVLKGLYS
jgi:mannan endo-1,6-alpha-mannosidase